MPYYPIFLDIEKKTCLVVGGGAVAERKVLSLLFSGARVAVISPQLTKKLKSLVKTGKIRHTARRYCVGDIEGAFLVVSATDSEEINKAVSKEARKAGTLLNVVDRPELCNFIVPSVVERGSLLVAISTSGKSPYLAKALRKTLERSIPPEMAVFVELMGAVRRKLLKENAKNDKKDRIYEALLNSPLLEWIKKGDRAAINRFLKKTVGEEGEGYTLSKLKVKL
ncbi:MAG: bifunctional precorrin-2 dehydrogenase/sirohydrochlorin ferrochelatase [Thermodesulfobacteriota bacterium]